MRKNKAPQPGFALALVLMLLALISVVLASVYTLTNFGQRLSQKFLHQAVASEAASAGLAHAIAELQMDASWSKGFSGQPLERSGASYELHLTGSETYRSRNNIAGRLPVKNGGRVVPAGCIHLVSVGRSAEITARSEVLMRVTTIPAFRQALSSQGKLSLRRSRITSYDSSRRRSRHWKTRRGADLRTSGSAKSSVTLVNSFVGGDILVGPGGGPETIASRSSVVTGQVRATPTPLEFSPPLSSPGESGRDIRFHRGKHKLAPGTYGRLSVSDATLVLSSGRYVFSSIDFQGGSLRVPNSGSSSYLFSAGPARFRDTTVINASRAPHRLWLLANDRVDITDAGNVHMLIYAPNSTVRLKQAQLFGAIVGAELSLTDVIARYDRSLVNRPGPVTEITSLASWDD